MQTILLIDDDPTEAFFIQDAIEEMESAFELVHEPSGARGLAALKGSIPDLVLLDLRMPGLTGFEVLDEIRKRQELKDMMVYVLSASSRAHEIEEAHTRGANGYLVKPHTPAGYIDLVEKLPVAQNS